MTSLDYNNCPKTNFKNNNLNYNGSLKPFKTEQNKTHNGDGIKGPHIKAVSNKHLGKNLDKLA